MTRGRKPKPTEKKKLEGNPGKRKLNDKEPSPDVVIPDPPDHFEGEALAEWKRITQELQTLRLVSAIDRASLVSYCQAWADYVKACDTIDEEGEVITSDKGGLYQNPWVSIKNSAMDRMVRISTEFGMTPSSRSRLKVETPTEEDEMKKMLMSAATKQGTKK